MAIYVPSLPAQVGTGDTAEYQTVPYVLGIAHPTGFPAYTLAGWAFSHLFAVNTVAWRMNALAAICTALTASGVVLLAAVLGADALAALAAALTFAFGSVVLQGAVTASPHALSGLLIVAALIGSVAFARSGDRRAFFAACACAGLGLATQPETLWVLPAIVVAALWQRRVFERRALIVSGALLLLPLVLYAYLPIRSAVVAAQHLDPNAAAPVSGADGFIWDYNHPRTLDGFLDEVLGRHEQVGSAVARSFDPLRVFAAAPFWLGHFTDQFDPWLFPLAALGCLALALRDRRALGVVVAGTAGGLLFAYSFRYDAELYRYFLVSTAVIAALAASAVRLPLPRVRPPAVTAGVTVALAVLAGAAWRANHDLMTALPYRGEQAVIDAVRRDVPDGAIIVTSWYDATTLGYGTAVEHVLGSRLIVHGQPSAYVDRFPAWARERHVVLFGWGSELDAGTVPPAWLRELPTSLRFYRLLEVAPPSITRH